MKINTPDYTPQLRSLMQKVGICSWKELSEKAGVPELQLIRLRRGLALQTRADILLKISAVLEISLAELLTNLAPGSVELQPGATEAIAREYQHLQVEMERQRESLMLEFQQSCLQILESWLLQWPTAAHKARENPKLAAVKILPLMHPVEKLMQEWGIEAIASVGAEVVYDPKLHQLIEGTAQAGELVKVRYTGYRQGDKLLYRAKVSPR